MSVGSGFGAPPQSERGSSGRVASAWGAPGPEPEPQGPEPGTWLKVPVVPEVDEQALQVLYERIRETARRAVADGLADAMGGAQT